DLSNPSPPFESPSAPPGFFRMIHSFFDPSHSFHIRHPPLWFARSQRGGLHDEALSFSGGALLLDNHFGHRRRGDKVALQLPLRRRERPYIAGGEQDDINGPFTPYFRGHLIEIDPFPAHRRHPSRRRSPAQDFVEAPQQAVDSHPPHKSIKELLWLAVLIVEENQFFQHRGQPVRRNLYLEGRVEGRPFPQMAADGDGVPL